MHLRKMRSFSCMRRYCPNKSNPTFVVGRLKPGFPTRSLYTNHHSLMKILEYDDHGHFVKLPQ